MSKKVLFIDRDGTIVLEPENYQLDCLSKLEFYPNAFQYLAKITKELNDRGIKQFSYITDTYVSESSAIVKRKVNFESEHYDFIVIYNSYNNSEVNRANYEKQNASNYDIITNCLSNVCVHNGP